MISLFFAFSTSENGIFSKVYYYDVIQVEASGSTKQVINGTKQMTKPIYAIDPVDKRYDWCSNCGRSYSEHPWISFTLRDRKIKMNGYYIRAGCCYTACCCEEYDYCVDCCLYSWSLQISDDNKTWTDIHKVERDDTMRHCNSKTYQLDKTYVTQYVRLIQNEACPGWPPCIAINKMDLFGEIIVDGNSGNEDFVSFHDDDDDVSIIGHISKNGVIHVK